MWMIWLLIAGICFVIEIYTVGFFVFWFSIGALFALISSFFISNFLIQTTIFVISSTLLIFFTKPLVKKFIKQPNLKPTNVYSIIGKEGIVLEDINSLESTGKIKVQGELWSATSDNIIQKNEKIKVLSINGVKAKVAKI